MSPNDSFQKILRYLWDVEIPQMLEVLPKEPLSLQSLLKMREPRYETRGGETFDVDRDELEVLKNLVPWLLHDQVFLPFVFQKRKGYLIFVGSKLEHWIVDTTLGFTTCSPFLMESYKPREYYHPHQFYRFKRQFPSLTIMILAHG